MLIYNIILYILIFILLSMLTCGFLMKEGMNIMNVNNLEKIYCNNQKKIIEDNKDAKLATNHNFMKKMNHSKEDTNTNVGQDIVNSIDKLSVNLSKCPN